jgi:hypothetical protein
MITKHVESGPRASFISLLAALLFTVSTDSFAMNREGHDGGWIDDFPPAITLLEAIPEARALPSRNCPVTPAMLANNPYEQIQLPRHRCPKEHRRVHSPIRQPPDDRNRIEGCL